MVTLTSTALLIATRNYELPQMLLSLFVVLKPFLIRRLNVAKVTPESGLVPLILLRPALAVTLPFDVGIQHGFAGAFDIAQMTNEKRYCKKAKFKLSI